MSVILSILAIVSMIIVHEWGHFIAGKIFKVPVYEFAIGMGPILFKHKGKSETTYTIRALPLGGFCAFDQDDDTGVVDSNLNKIPIWQRLIVFVAGPLMNIITAIIIAISLYAFVGIPHSLPVVAQIVNEDLIGVLEVGDEFLYVNGESVDGSVEKLSELLSKNPTETQDVVVLRNEKEVAVKLNLYYDEASDSYLMGIYQAAEYVPCNLIDSAKYGVMMVKDDSVAVIETIKGLFTREYQISDMSGVVGAVSIMSSSLTTSGIASFLSIAVLISVNLGLMNLLPIPGLDGSKILFGTIEMITKKRIPEKIEIGITLTSMGLLFLLFGYLIIIDIIRLL